jgi:hypothetical protein
VYVAIYIEMGKVIETEDYVEYTFGRGGDVGLIRLDKIKETISVIKECPLDVSGKWSERAGMKLARLFVKGEFPEKTQWAS